MRTSEQRVGELHSRMNTYRQEKRQRRYMTLCAAVCMVTLVLTAAASVVIAGSGFQGTVPRPDGMSASIFTDHGALSYIVTGLLAFCLGVSFTIFCFRLRKHMEEDGDAHRDN